MCFDKCRHGRLNFPRENFRRLLAAKDALHMRSGLRSLAPGLPIDGIFRLCRNGLQIGPEFLGKTAAQRIKAQQIRLLKRRQQSLENQRSIVIVNTFFITFAIALRSVFPH